MLEGIRSKQGQGFIQTALNLSEEPAGIVKIPIPDQGNQTETKFRSKGSPDPGEGLGSNLNNTLCNEKMRKSQVEKKSLLLI